MKAILNIFVYCNYLIQVKLHYLFNRINPAGLLLYIPFIKKKFERKNQDPWEEFNKAFTDKNNGHSVLVAHIVSVGIIFILFISSVLYISGVFHCQDKVDEYYFIACGVVSMLIYYIYILKEDKYLICFKKYEKWTRIQKRIYIVISFLVILASIAYFCMSLMCC